MHSAWYLLTQACSAEIKAVAAAMSVGWLENPALPIDLGVAGPDGVGAKHSKALFVLQRGDRLEDQPGNVQERRRMRFVLGAVALGADGAQQADLMHFAARVRLREDAVWDRFRLVAPVQYLQEVEVERDLKDVAVAGIVLMSAFEIEYRQTYTNAA